MDDLALIAHHDDPTPALVVCSRCLIPGAPHTFGDIIGIYVDSGEVDFGREGNKAFWVNATLMKPSEARALMGVVGNREDVEAGDIMKPAHSAVTTAGIDAETIATLQRRETFVNVSATVGGAREGKIRMLKGQIVEGSKRGAK